MNDTDDTTDPGMESKELIHLPRTSDGLLPPRPTDLVTQAAEMWEEHYDECLELLDGISGDQPPIHGSGVANEWALVFKFKEFAKLKGKNGLANLNAAQLRVKMRAGLKRRTGHPFHAIEQQGVRLRIAQRREERLAAE